MPQTCRKMVLLALGLLGMVLVACSDEAPSAQQPSPSIDSATRTPESTAMPRDFGVVRAYASAMRPLLESMEPGATPPDWVSLNDLRDLPTPAELEGAHVLLLRAAQSAILADRHADLLSEIEEYRLAAAGGGYVPPTCVNRFVADTWTWPAELLEACDLRSLTLATWIEARSEWSGRLSLACGFRESESTWWLAVERCVEH